LSGAGPRQLDKERRWTSPRTVHKAWSAQLTHFRSGIFYQKLEFYFVEKAVWADHAKRIIKEGEIPSIPNGQRRGDPGDGERCRCLKGERPKVLLKDLANRAKGYGKSRREKEGSKHGVEQERANN